jgi:hypothetical protein
MDTRSSISTERRRSVSRVGASFLRSMPNCVAPALLVLESILFFSERHKWFGVNQYKGWTVLITMGVAISVLLVSLACVGIAACFSIRVRYNLRSLLLFVVAIALPSAWLSAEAGRAKRQRDIVDRITNDFQGTVHFDFERRSHYDYSDSLPAGEPAWLLGVRGVDQYGDEMPAPGPDWLRELLGVDFFADVEDVSYECRNAIAAYDRAEVTDADMETLKELHHVKFLSLGDAKVTDAGINSLAGLSDLERVDLGGTQITDAGLSIVKNWPRLWLLVVADTQLTDAGLRALEGHPNLGDVNLERTGVTGAGVKRLRTALPKCRIVWQPPPLFPDDPLGSPVPIEKKPAVK